jgi:hypothetical protein
MRNYQDLLPSKGKLIGIQGVVVIEKDIHTVFSMISNPSNDSKWRTEITESKTNGPVEIGTLVYEYSYLSKRAPHHLLVLKCTEYVPNRMVVFETGEDSGFYLRSRRTVNALSEHRTEVKYELEFDLELVKFALGFSLPKFLVRYKSQQDMRKYLNRLKSVLS